MKTGLSIFAVAALAGLILLACMYRSAVSDPVIRTFRYTPEDWPAAAAPMRLVLLTDAHVSGPDMPPARLSRIVGAINALKPDVVLLGGDFVSAAKTPREPYSVPAAIAPLRGLKVPSGVIAVMGNHDHWVDATAVRREIARAGVTLLDNKAVRVGPLVIGGVDDAYTAHDDIKPVAREMTDLGGVPILLSHSPDPSTPPVIKLVLAGHTHCGQVSLPFLGPVVTMSRYGRRFACGVSQANGQRLIVSAGVGTSLLPLRLNAPPDIWVIEVGPPVK